MKRELCIRKGNCCYCIGDIWELVTLGKRKEWEGRPWNVCVFVDIQSLSDETAPGVILCGHMNPPLFGAQQCR